MFMIQKHSKEGWKRTRYIIQDQSLTVPLLNQLRNVFPKDNFKIHEIDIEREGSMLVDLDHAEVLAIERALFTAYVQASRNSKKEKEPLRILLHRLSETDTLVEIPTLPMPA